MPNAWNWSNFFFAEFKSSLHFVSSICHLQAHFLFYSPCWLCNCRYIKFFKSLEGHFMIPQQFHQMGTLLQFLNFELHTACGLPHSNTVRSVAASSAGVGQSVFHRPCFCYMDITDAAFLTLRWVGPGAGSFPSLFKALRNLMMVLLPAGTWETKGVFLYWWSNWLFLLPFLSLNWFLVSLLRWLLRSERIHLGDGVDSGVCQSSASSGLLEDSTVSNRKTDWHLTPLMRASVFCGPTAVRCIWVLMLHRSAYKPCLHTMHSMQVTPLSLEWQLVFTPDTFCSGW